jgi:hypothetical protein
MGDGGRCKRCVREGGKTQFLISFVGDLALICIPRLLLVSMMAKSSLTDSDDLANDWDGLV